MTHEHSVNTGTREVAPIMEERLLAQRAADGDEDAFVRIMQRYNQQLYRLAVAVVGDKSEAEDVLQESYLRAFGRMGDYAGDGRLGSWLASIVRNEAIDRLRLRNRRRQHIALEVDMRARSGDEPALLKAHADETLWNPETEAERLDIRRLIERAISQLPDAFRAVFILREVEGLTVEETADYLGIPDATVKSRDFRARAMLKAKLGEKIDAGLPQAFTFLNQDCASLVARVMKRMRPTDR
jgi:RNA polymerase sigma-70 factor (ECF subfamily)